MLAQLSGEPAHLDLPTSVAVPREVLERYVGTYARSGADAFVIALNDNHLTSQSKRDEPRRLDAESPTTFHFRNAPIVRFEFETDASGRATKLLLRIRTKLFEFARTTPAAEAHPTPP